MGLVGDTQKEIFFGGFQRERERESGARTVAGRQFGSVPCVDSKRASGCARRRVGAQCWRAFIGVARRARAKSCASSKGAVVVRCRKVGTGEWKCRQPVTKPGPLALALSRSNVISSHPAPHFVTALPFSGALGDALAIRALGDGGGQDGEEGPLRELRWMPGRGLRHLRHVSGQAQVWRAR